MSTTTKFPWQIEEAKRLANQIATETRTDVVGAKFWVSSGNPVPMDCFERAGLEAPAAQQAAIDYHTDCVLRDYCINQANRKPSAEEMFEMRAAFGPGATVVDVITGRTIKL